MPFHFLRNGNYQALFLCTLAIPKAPRNSHCGAFVWRGDRVTGLESVRCGLGEYWKIDASRKNNWRSQGYERRIYYCIQMLKLDTHNMIFSLDPPISRQYSLQIFILDKGFKDCLLDNQSTLTPYSVLLSVFDGRAQLSCIFHSVATEMTGESSRNVLSSIHGENVDVQHRAKRG